MENSDKNGDTHGSISRRDFIKGIIASGVTVSSVGYLFRAGEAAQVQPGLPGAVERLVTLTVNGQKRRVDIMKQETLAMTLRYKLGLTGTKLGCDRAECGNCTVLIDDVPRYSCSVLTHTVRNAKITTIEGLAGADGKLHPVQKAFVDELAPQCGFCTPGQIMSTVALLKINPKPTRAQAAEALSGNLCRCGAYDYSLNAVMRAAEVS
ncbi:MAG: (2Fe-2S)-binding protein [Deltaproteobacteria bacterium RIFCSPLOWO2_12_55_13]|nr:MAG: (2Fe-2S)-binding protein [Deltaproteobacteria bacterium RIFCSPLOWO2_12_55_13]